MPAIEHKGFVLRAYSKKIFPTYHDPYASGPKTFSSVVLIDTIPSGAADARRYAIVLPDAYPTQSSEVIK